VRFDKLFNFRFIRDVNTVAFELGAGPASQVLQGVELFLLPISDNYMGILIQECQAHGASQSARATSNNYHIVVVDRLF
jgi:hypothetical protein